MSKERKLLVIDGNNYLHRAFYATPELSTKKGVPTALVRGFMSIVIADMWKVRPTHLLVCFDKYGKKNWRSEIFPAYKQNRKIKDDDPKAEEKRTRSELFRSQMPNVRKLLRAMGIRILHKSGEEADDLIGTIAKEYEAKGFTVVVASNDKDLRQLVTAKVFIQRPDRSIEGRKQVKAEYGVGPEKIVPLLALQGDNSDNIDGIYKCGKKTASKLLQEYGSIDGILKARKANKLTPSLSKNIKAFGRENLERNVKLITIKTDIPHKVKEVDLRIPSANLDLKAVRKLCKELELVTTLKQIENGLRSWNK